MGFAWRFLESLTAFSKSGDWVTIVAVEDWDTARDLRDCCEQEECKGSRVESRTNAGDALGMMALVGQWGGRGVN